MHGILPVIFKEISSELGKVGKKSFFTALRLHKYVASSVWLTLQAEIFNWRYDEWTFFMVALIFPRFCRFLSCQKIPYFVIDTMFSLDLFSWILSVLLSDDPLTIQRMSMSVFPYLITLSGTWIDIVAKAAIENGKYCHT